jgi:hypothetical protein
MCLSPPLLLSVCLSVSVSLGSNVSQWLLDGFNGTLISYGANPTKTESLYGADLVNRNEPNLRKGFVYEILRDLYQKIETRTREENLTTILSISLWALKGNSVIESVAHRHSLLPHLTSLL